MTDNNDNKRGFANMDPAEIRRLASEGGKKAHRTGKAHKWTREEARAAGRLGGLRQTKTEAEAIAKDGE